MRSPARRRVVPRGGIAWSSRTITLTTASRGRPRSRTRWPTIASSAAIGYSRISAPSRRIVPPSASGRGSAGSLVVTPRRAAQRLERRALQQRRDEHGEEDDVEQLAAARHLGDHRERREHHRHRAAQPGPAEHDPLALAEAWRTRWPGRPPAAARPPRRSARARCPRRQMSSSWCGNTSRPSVRNIADLGDPREALVERGDRLLGGDRGRAEREPGQVDGEEARAVQRVGAAERERRDRQRRDRVQPGGRELRAAERLHAEPADARRRPRARSRAGARAAAARRRSRSRACLMNSISASTSRTATGSLRPDSPSSVRASRRRSVELRSSAKIAAPSVLARTAPTSRPSLSVECRTASAAATPAIAAVIGVAISASDDRRAEHRADLHQARGQAALEQDQRQRDDPDRARELVVVERDPAGAVGADQPSPARGTAAGRGRAASPLPARPAGPPRAARPRRGSADRRGLSARAQILWR